MARRGGERTPLLTSDGAPLGEAEINKKRSRQRCLTAACLLVVICLLVAALLAIIWVFLHPAYDESPTVRVSTAAVASDAKPCSVIGTDILKAGGSAVDSAIATLLCVGVHNQQSMGIGGGSFMIVYDTPRNGSEKEFVTFNAREVAPLAATADMYVNKPFASARGGLAVGVPGEIRGYYEAWQKFGRLPWADLFQPTIKLCREGYEILPSLGEALTAPSMRTKPDVRRLYVDADGKPLKTGDIAKRPRLADTLEKIAEEGPDVFYTGEMARDIVSEIQQAGGIITEEDLQNYKVKTEPAHMLELKNSGYRVHALGPPSGGPILSFMLNVLDKFNLDPESEDDDEVSALTHHKIIETFKFGYALRTRLGDADFVDVTEVMKNLTSDEFALDVKNAINLTSTQDIWYYHPDYFLGNESGTSHLSVVSPDGGVVSVTSSVNVVFGSAVVGNKTGILYNDQMDDFSTPGLQNDWGLYPSPANFIAPGKRPLSSMTPVIITDRDGEVVLATGGAGGSKITTITTFVAAQTLFMGKDISGAIDTPRVHHQLLPNAVQYEEALSQGILDGLAARNHEFRPPGNQAVVQGIQVKCNRADSPELCIIATSDSRKPSGGPDGY